MAAHRHRDRVSRTPRDDRQDEADLEDPDVEDTDPVDDDLYDDLFDDDREADDLEDDGLDDEALHDRTPVRPAAALAELPVPRPVLTAVVMGLVPTVFVWVGTWLGNYAGTHGTRGSASLYVSTLLVAATCVTMAALAAVFFMARMNDPLPRFGLRRPRPWASLAWLLPLVLLGWMWLERDGVSHSVRTSDDVATGAFTVAVTLAEVFWLQGLVQAVLRPRGRRYAVLTTAVLAAVLRFVEGLGSQLAGNPRQTSLAMPSLLVATAYVLLVALVAGCLVELTGSLWTALVARVAIEVALAYGLDVSLINGHLHGLGVLLVLAVWAGVMYLRLPPDPLPDDALPDDEGRTVAGETPA